MNFDAFQTIAEISITLAGFVGIIVVLQKDDHGFTKVALVSILVNTVGTAFFAFLPDLLFQLIPEGISWRVSCFIYGSYHVFFMIRHLNLQRELREMSVGLRGMIFGSTMAIILKLSVAAGLLLDWSYVIYYAALIWSLCIAVFFFATLLLETRAESERVSDDA